MRNFRQLFPCVIQTVTGQIRQSFRSGLVREVEELNKKMNSAPTAREWPQTDKSVCDEIRLGESLR